MDGLETPWTEAHFSSSRDDGDRALRPVRGVTEVVPLPAATFAQVGDIYRKIVETEGVSPEEFETLRSLAHRLIDHDGGGRDPSRRYGPRIRIQVRDHRFSPSRWGADPHRSDHARGRWIARGDVTVRWKHRPHRSRDDASLERPFEVEVRAAIPWGQADRVRPPRHPSHPTFGVRNRRSTLIVCLDQEIAITALMMTA